MTDANVSLSRLRLFLAPHAATATDGIEAAASTHSVNKDNEDNDESNDKIPPPPPPPAGSVATVSALSALTKEFQRVRYLLEASLPGYKVGEEDIMIWDMKNPAFSAQYEQNTAGLLELDSWVAVEDLGPSIAQVYTYGFTSVDSHHGMKFTTGNIALENPGKKGKRQYVLCKIATGRSLAIDNEDAAEHRLPAGYNSYYIARKSKHGYYHEYIINNTLQILPQYLVRFSYQAIDPKHQRPCALCEKNAATVVCRACEAELCKHCDESSHAANKLMSRHKRTPIRAEGEYLSENAIMPPVPCRLHESKLVEFYCPMCATPVCVNCKMVGDHSCGEKGLHRLISIAEAYEHSIKESSKPDPLIESRKMLIGNKLSQLQERVEDIQRNRAAIEKLIRATMEAALKRLDEEAKIKLDVLMCEELELKRQVEHIEWTDQFLAKQRSILSPVEFLAAWNQHKPLRIEQREFPVAQSALVDTIKADIQLVGRLQVVSGDDPVIEVPSSPLSCLEGSEQRNNLLSIGHHRVVMSPKGKKIIEEVRNDLMKAAAHSPTKLSQETMQQAKATAFSNFSSTLRGISINQRRTSNPHVSVKNDLWSNKLRKEMGIPPNN